MHRASNFRMTALNPHLTCVLCDGYFVDATTIVECLHSFCRACIVKYLETNKFCPVCDVQVHKTKPLLSIRSDKTLQDVVYKLVPRLYQNEMKRRRDFYSKHPDEAARCTSEERGEGANHRFIYTPDETISLSLEYYYGNDRQVRCANGEETDSSKWQDKVPQKRYLQCPAAITVGHLKKFLFAKFALPRFYEVEISYSEDVLKENYTLMDIAYIFAWRRSGPMRLFYRVKSRMAKRRKFSHHSKVISSMAKETETPQKLPILEISTLKLLPSPSAAASEFKFVLKTVGTKKEKSSDHSINADNQRLTSQCESKVNALQVQSSVSSNKLDMTPCSATAEKLDSNTEKRHIAEMPKEKRSPPVDDSTVMTAVAVLPDFQSAPVLSHGTSNQVAAPMCSTKAPSVSKRSTRSRIKNRPFQRPPLVRLAPYPSPRTTPAATNSLTPQVNQFAPSPVACFPAPPATGLSTAPVKCLGTVSVSYLPNAPVTCFGPSTVSGAAGLNVSNLMPSAVSNVPITTSLSQSPLTNTCTQSSVSVSPMTNVVSSTYPPPKLENISSSSVLAKNSPVVTTVISTCSLSTITNTSVNTERNFEVTSTVTSSVNSHPMPATIPVAPKLSFTRPIREKHLHKSTLSVEIKSPFSASSQASTIPVVETRIDPTPATSTAITSSVPVDSAVILISPNTISRESTLGINTVSKSSPSVSFSVNNLLPNITSEYNIPNSVHVTKVKVDSSCPVPTSIPKQTDYIKVLESPLMKEKIPTNAINKNPPSSIISEKQNFSINNVESLSSVTPEKNSINTPFKEVKSSITAEFSDNDDLGCQPDLVVDEQKIESSENEDEAEEALRRKITAIAEKDDEVDVENDTETDSGRASDVSNQARSSCDDDIGSPLPIVRIGEAERTVQTTSVSVKNFIPVASTVPCHSPKVEDLCVSTNKPNGIDRIISNLHRNHERKDNIGALDLSTSCRKPGEDITPRPRPRPVANPPVLDAKHRQPNCLSAPTKQHTVCAPAPTSCSSPFHIRPLSASVRHSMITAPQNHLTKIPPVTIPHFSPSTLMDAVKNTHTSPFCKTPRMPIPFQGIKSSPRQTKSNSSRSNSCHRKSPTANCTPSTNGRKDCVSPRRSAPSPSAPLTGSPHHRLSPCATPPKIPATPTPLHPQLKPSTSNYKMSRQPIPIYKKSDSYKNSPHHNRFKGSNLTVINPDPNGFRQRIVIKNLDSRPNNHNHHR